MSQQAGRNDERRKQSPESGNEPRSGSEAGKPKVREIGGRKGPDPTRYGDWEKNGRCIDF